MSPQLSDHCHYLTCFPASSSHCPQQICSTAGLTLSSEHLSALPERTFTLNVSMDHKFLNSSGFFYSEMYHRMYYPCHSKAHRSPQGIPTLNKHCKMQTTSIIWLSPQLQEFITKLRAILDIKLGHLIMKLDCYLLVQTSESMTSWFCIK